MENFSKTYCSLYYTSWCDFIPKGLTSQTEKKNMLFKVPILPSERPAYSDGFFCMHPVYLQNSGFTSRMWCSATV